MRTTGDWVIVAGHRQARGFAPIADECPLCPSRDGHLTEVPAADYEVAVFENRFPALTSVPGAIGRWRRRAAIRTGRRPMRGDLLLQRARHDVRRTQGGSGAIGTGGVDRPQPGTVEASGCPAGVLFREPRTGDGCQPAASARPDLRVPVRDAADGPDARAGTGLPASARRQSVRRPGGRRDRGRRSDHPGYRRLGRVRPVRGPLAVRGPPVPAPAPARSPRARRRAAGLVRRASMSTCFSASSGCSICRRRT